MPYLRFRYFDPDSGRYISADPIGQHAASNVFGYASENPSTYIDPHGLVVINAKPPNAVFTGSTGANPRGYLQRFPPPAVNKANCSAIRSALPGVNRAQAYFQLSALGMVPGGSSTSQPSHPAGTQVTVVRGNVPSGVQSYSVKTWINTKRIKNPARQHFVAYHESLHIPQVPQILFSPTPLTPAQSAAQHAAIWGQQAAAMDRFLRECECAGI